MDNIKKSFGQGVRKRRFELDLSQEELAMKSGLHRTYISDIELGNRNVSLINIVKLVDALNLSLVDFFSNYYGQ